MLTSRIPCLRILDRYLLREVGQTWLVVTLVLLFILLSSTFARVLGEAASNDLPKEAVFTVLGLLTITYLTVLVPVGLYLAIMLALGRLYRDSEMAAFQACGIGPQKLYTPLMFIAFIIAAFVAWLSMVATPWAANYVEQIERQARRVADFSRLVPGQFIRPNTDDDLVFYAEDVGDDGLLRNVFIQRKVGETVELVIAAKGEQRKPNGDGRPAMVLYDGRRYEGVPGTVDYWITRFGEHGIPVEIPEPEDEEPEPGALPTEVLLQSKTPEHLAEFQWRLSPPIVAVVLTLLAVPLARTRPREGRYGRLAVGVLIFLLYYNLLGAARVWTEQGVIPHSLGLWWVHGLIVCLALLMLAKQTGAFRSAKRVRAS